MSRINPKTTDKKIERSGKILWYLFLAAVVLTVFVVSMNWYQLLLIQGNSMQPTYHNMQFAVLDKHSEDYEQGDVIAFRCNGLNEVVVKRIIACPDDSAVIVSGTLYINGEVSDVYPESVIFEYAGLLENEITLQEGEYLVIGDNIRESRDSRYDAVGIISEADIIGEIIKAPKPLIYEK